MPRELNTRFVERRPVTIPPPRARELPPRASRAHFIFAPYRAGIPACETLVQPPSKISPSAASKNGFILAFLIAPHLAQSKLHPSTSGRSHALPPPKKTNPASSGRPLCQPSRVRRH